MNLNIEISSFLREHGFSCSHESIGLQEIIVTRLQKDPDQARVIIPVTISATDIETAQEQQSKLCKTIQCVSDIYDSYPLIITQDRWVTQREMMHKRILSHLEVFFPIYARNCEVRRIEKNEASDFLRKTHSYGDAACRYRYGMFLKRHTGHIAGSRESYGYEPGTLVAVATFSNARKWIKGDKTIRSYEWTRYASLPEIRVNGGMGKLLNAFIEEVQPDDIMSYADLEWSEGTVYEKLGFISEGSKSPVAFEIGPDMQRRPVPLPTQDSTSMPAPDSTSMPAADSASLPAADSASLPAPTGNLFHINQGSRKYRLKLTEYE